VPAIAAVGPISSVIARMCRFIILPPSSPKARQPRAAMTQPFVGRACSLDNVLGKDRDRSRFGRGTSGQNGRILGHAKFYLQW
jgi:hypothetical protein